MSPEPLSAEAVEAIRSGDRRAFERLFREWYGTLASYAARIVPGADAAEDVVQEVFIAIWRGRATLPDASKLSAYLHRSVRNRALNHLRGTRRMTSIDDENAVDPSVEPIAETELIGAETAAAVQQALAELPPRTREIFLLSRDQGLTYAQIAETLGISVKTVETLMGRALKSLRTALAPHVTRDT